MIMTKNAVLLVMGLLLAPALPAQKLELKFDSLASKAAEKAELDVDPAALGKLMEGAKLPGSPSSVKEAHIRNYKFAKEGEYSQKEFDALRKQLADNPGWNRLVIVKDKRETVEIYGFQQDGQYRGYLILACEPAEVSIVHVIGDVTLEQIKAMVTSKIEYGKGS